MPVDVMIEDHDLLIRQPDMPRDSPAAACRGKVNEASALWCPAVTEDT